MTQPTEPSVVASSVLRAGKMSSSNNVEAVSLDGTAQQQKVKTSLYKQNMQKTHWFVLSRTIFVLSFFVVAITCMSLGLWLFVVNDALKEVYIDYTECRLAATTNMAPPSSAAPNAAASSVVSWQFNNFTTSNGFTLGNCTINFRVPQNIVAPVYMYVRITNMFQNHRYYVNSRDLNQESGQNVAVSSMSNCGWAQYANCSTASGKTWVGFGTQAENNVDCYGNPSTRSALINNTDANAQYYPCGLIANSMFLDQPGTLECLSTSCSGSYTFSQSGIAWPQELSAFGKTVWLTDSRLSNSIRTNLIPPPMWRRSRPDLYSNGYYAQFNENGSLNSSNIPDLSTWETYMVWMRKAGLPNFRKLWGQNTGQTLTAGVYSISILDTFDAARFQGTKGLVFAQAGPIGGKNDFFGIAFIVVSCISGALALAGFLYRPRKLADRSLMSFEKAKSN